MKRAAAAAAACTMLVSEKGRSGWGCVTADGVLKHWQRLRALLAVALLHVRFAVAEIVCNVSWSVGCLSVHGCVLGHLRYAVDCP